jgi:hypothetical protein
MKMCEGVMYRPNFLHIGTSCTGTTLNFSTFSKDVLAMLILRFRPAFWYRDIDVDLRVVLSTFMSRPVSLLPSITDCLF